MKKKILIGIAIALLVVVVGALVLTRMFTRGMITGKIYRVDNVYEEIWNMVNSEKYGNQTVLTTAIEGASTDYDFGSFQSVSIPVNEEYFISLSFYDDELQIYLFKNDQDNNNTDEDAHYVYNYLSNTLYGDHEESLLFDNFISQYYTWVGNDGKFNPENQGNYTYVYEKYPLPPHE